MMEKPDRLCAEEAMDKMASSPDVLKEAEDQRCLDKHGPNELEERGGINSSWSAAFVQGAFA